MRTLIANGTIVTADGSYVADVLVDGETIAQIGTRPGGARASTADETIDAARQVRDPGRDRRPHPHGAAVRRHVREGHVRDGHAGRGVRRHDDDRRLRGPVRGQSLRAGLDAWHAKAEGNAVVDYGFHMIMSDVNDDTLAEMDQLVAEGVPGLQAVHRLPGRVLQPGRPHLPRDAADREERRADHDARGERAGDRHRRGAARRRGQDRPLLPRRRALPDLRGRGDEPRDPPGRGGGRARVHRPPLGEGRARRRPRRPGPRRAGVRRDVPAVPVPLSLDDLGNGFEGAKFVCSPPLREKDPHWEELWAGLEKDDLQVVSTDHCPFDFHGQKELGRGDFRKIPNGLPGVEDRVDLLHDGGVVAGRISQERWVDDHLDRAGEAVRDVPAQGRDRRRRGRGHRRLRPEPEADDQRGEPPHGRRLLVLRGLDRSRARRTSCSAAARSSSATASSPGARATAGSSSAAPADYARLASTAQARCSSRSSTATSSPTSSTRSSTRPAPTTRRRSASPATCGSTSCARSRTRTGSSSTSGTRDEAAAPAHRDTPHYAAWREATVDMFVEPRYGVRYEGLFPETPPG